MTTIGVMSTHTFTILGCMLVAAGCSHDIDTVGPAVAPQRAPAPHSDLHDPPSPPAAASPVSPAQNESGPPPSALYQDRPLSAWLVELKSRDASVRLRAVEALGQIGPGSPDVVPALIRALADEDTRLRSSAVDQLGRFGPASPLYRGCWSFVAVS